MTNLNGEHRLLRIYVHYTDRFQGTELAHYILKEARENQLAGCTMLRDMGGFGAHRVYHTEMAFEGAGDPDYILEIVDRKKKIDDFVLSHQESLKNALLTEENVFVHSYSAANKNETNGHPKSESREERPMNQTNLSGPQSLLRIFLGETDKVDHKLLHADILTRAKKFGLAGCTVIRGMAGFGASSVIHEPHIFRLSSDMPVVIEIIDSQEKVRSFLKEVEPSLQGSLVTEEEVHVLHYSSIPRKK